MDGDLDAVIGVEWVSLVLPGIQMGRVFWGTQLGYIGSRTAISVRWYDLAMV